MRLYGSRFILDGQLDNFTTNLCGSWSAKTPTASSRPPELAPELARPRQPGEFDLPRFSGHSLQLHSAVWGTSRKRKSERVLASTHYHQLPYAPVRIALVWLLSSNADIKSLVLQHVFNMVTLK
jgi:hypothetical protein